eukprot:gnl/Hemi2/8014_TR2761_c0_g6_i1.p1 gnl/Hemi2/8014_TR2761_c0_g6~~gnl/Hemi2/8014_TR2761_c0_g6_i1.p1  ORF type:complete len:332 (+),score=79.69 gnl/Hemi2/8014_TR2761_c0_g6_i1:29-997(+)
MDALLASIEKKRKQAAAPNGAPAAKKYRSKGDIEREKEEAARLLAKQKLEARALESLGPVAMVQDNAEKAPAPSPSPPPVAERKVIPRHKVIKKLRKMGEPVTLFGETDEERQARMQHLVEHETEHTEGMANDFQKHLASVDSHESRERTQKEVQQETAADAELPEDSVEYFILLWFRKLLKEWELFLMDRPDHEKNTAQGRAATATLQQTRQHVAPLFNSLLKRNLLPDILEQLHDIVQYMKAREYVKANSSYLQLAIGNAAWPMGVTMVGIHERCREKINSSKVAHVLNDETQRRYIQGVKRLMTFCQQKYPTDPSKSVG